MAHTFSKRQRQVLLTSILATVFLLAAFVGYWVFSKPPEPYRPGEMVEGITADLARTLPPDYPRVRFVDATTEAGIAFTHFHGKRSSQLPEDMGSGAAWLDYDNDGWLDLFLVNQSGPVTASPEEIAASPAACALYHNNGDGTFTDVSKQAGVDFRGWGMAVARGDYDNDGDTDLFLTTYGENILYNNNGDGTFSNRTRRAGLGGRASFWGGAAWGDFNNDGFLDLYVCGYVKYHYEDPNKVEMQYDVEVPSSLNPSSYAPERNLLYKNNGDGTFTEMAAAAGVLGDRGRSLSAVWCDFDEDGWPDLYVANDVSDNVFFHNRGDGTFADISHEAWVADYRGAMGIAVGDWDLDTDLDMFVTHWIAQENALFNNLRAQMAAMPRGRPARLQFMDEADSYGLGQIALDYIGWGTSFFDYDNDGRLDVFVANGSTFQEKDQPWLLIRMPNLLFWNRSQQEGFYDVSGVSGDVFSHQEVSRGAAFGDYDNDGDLDIFILNNCGPGVLLKNEGGNQNNWLEVKLRGVRSNRSAIGARLRLTAGDQVMVRQIGVQSPYFSQNSLVAHFGLGQRTRADTLQIVWPGGARQELHALPANQLLEIREGQKAVR